MQLCVGEWCMLTSRHLLYTDHLESSQKIQSVDVLPFFGQHVVDVSRFFLENYSY